MISEYPAKCIKCKSILCDDCAEENDFICKNCGGGTIEQSKNRPFKSIRRSHIELYKKCPHSFYLQVCEGVESPSNVYNKNGIELHELFDRSSQERCITGISNDARKVELIQKYTAIYKGFSDSEFQDCQSKLSLEEFKEQQYQNGLNCIDGFLSMCSDMPIPWKTEERLECDVPGSKIKATIAFDRINLNEDGTYDLLDYKTGKVYVGKKLREDLQPALYIKCVEDNYHIKINRFIFLFVGENKKRIYNRNNEDMFTCCVGNKKYTFSISDKMKEISSIFNEIEAGNFAVPNNVSEWYCRHQCGMLNLGLCKGKFLEQWRAH